MRAFAFLLLPLLALAGCAEDAAPAEPLAAPEPAPSSPSMEHGEGVSTRSGAAEACFTTPAPHGCVGFTGQQMGELRTNGTSGEGTLHLEWAPPQGVVVALRVTLEGTDVAAVGASPLEIPVPALAAGAYRVVVEPTNAAYVGELVVAWTFSGPGFAPTL